MMRKLSRYNWFSFIDPAHRWILCMVLWFCFPGPLASFADETTDSNKAATAAESNSVTNSTDSQIQEQLDKLSLEEKVGSLFVIGFSQKDLNAKLLKLIKQNSFSSFIVFKHNIDSATQIAQFNRKIRALFSAEFPPFIMIDQEGGEVTRIQIKPPPPSALSLGASGNRDYAFRAGQTTGKILSSLGFNVNLAPVLDLSDPTKVNFVGNRSFGRNPNIVSRFAGEFARGLDEEKILSVFKHYPGHGSLTADSHKSVPVKTESMNELVQSDLVPFKNLTKQFPISAVMTAHVAFPNIDPTGSTATFSKVLIQQVLRGDLGYRGLVMTDDIGMKGASDGGGIGERAVRAFEAGTDLIMVAWGADTQIQARQALLNAVKQGRISEARVNESVLRILQIKNSRSNRQPATQKELVNNLVSNFSEMRKLTREITQTKIKSALPSLRWPLDTNRKILVLSGHESFIDEFKKSWKGTAQSFTIHPKNIRSMKKWLAKYPDDWGIYYASGTTTAKALSELEPKDKARLIVINTTYPGLIEDPEFFLGVIDLNTRDSTVGQWIARELNERPEEFRSPAENSE